MREQDLINVPVRRRPMFGRDLADVAAVREGLKAEIDKEVGFSGEIAPVLRRFEEAAAVIQPALRWIRWPNLIAMQPDFRSDRDDPSTMPPAFTPRSSQMSRCSRVWGMTPSSAATTSKTRSMPAAPAIIWRTKRS